MTYYNLNIPFTLYILFILPATSLILCRMTKTERVECKLSLLRTQDLLARIYNRFLSLKT